ncbi:tRNA1Val (adenine37-N6)-methyltransferase [Xylanibacter ruminicola]|uniref:tRNA1(Val) (adenine(37)-N6)-methyltransferase n=2 Tax=Xylanibacter ruminicola TaxID=839 RepID=A0A1M6UZ13_XYLRU|nr:tRNA1Val (adenine37-N6)-methyltransferase [Xylanibacter ruminicola]
MGKNSFQFKQFTINQERCAMKVGTDGTLLGAWANAPERPCRILDIGTGTGLLALMMAQRYPEASVVGIDIDKDAAMQAQENVGASPFSDRITIIHGDATKIEDKEEFDAIVCNPPYFVDSLICPKDQRTLARHTVSLTYEQLMGTAYKLLKNDGVFSIVVPTENNDAIESAAAFAGFLISRICMIKTTPNKLPKRQLIELRKVRTEDLDFKEVILEEVHNQRSEWYFELTKEFYLK